MRPRRLGGLVVLAFAVAATGCSHALSQPMPAASGRLALAVTREQPSKTNDMPLGVHQIPDASVYVSGHQGAIGVGMLFGLVGVAISHAAAQSTGESKTEAVAQQLRLDVAEMAERAVAQAMALREDDERLALATPAPGGRLELAPFLLLNFVGNDQVRPWVVVRATMKDPKGGETWKTRYFACGDDRRPLAGPDGWAPGEGGEPLRAAAESSLRAVLDVFFRDVAGQLERGKGKAATIKGQWPWVKQPLAISAEIVAEIDDLLVVVPKVSDAIVFAGVIIVPRTLVEVLPP